LQHRPLLTAILALSHYSPNLTFTSRSLHLAQLNCPFLLQRPGSLSPSISNSHFLRSSLKTLLSPAWLNCLFGMCIQDWEGLIYMSLGLSSFSLGWPSISCEFLELFLCSSPYHTAQHATVWAHYLLQIQVWSLSVFPGDGSVTSPIISSSIICPNCTPFPLLHGLGYSKSHPSSGLLLPHPLLENWMGFRLRLESNKN
jgi:hypothetical protein